MSEDAMYNRRRVPKSELLCDSNRGSSGGSPGVATDDSREVKIVEATSAMCRSAGGEDGRALGGIQNISSCTASSSIKRSECNGSLPGHTPFKRQSRPHARLTNTHP